MRVLPLATATLASGTELYRVQRPLPAAGPAGLAIGAVHLPATGALHTAVFGALIGSQLPLVP